MKEEKSLKLQHGAAFTALLCSLKYNHTLECKTKDENINEYSAIWTAAFFNNLPKEGFFVVSVLIRLYGHFDSYFFVVVEVIWNFFFLFSLFLFII